VTEFLIGRAQARLLYSPPGTAPDAVRRDVIDLLHRVPPRFEHAAALAQLREHAKVYPDAGPAAPATPPNDWSTIELYLMGVREANEQRYATAVHYFAAARDRCDDNERPLKYWSHFQLADCSARLNRTDEAILEYAGCIALRSDGAWPYYNLGLIYAVQDDPTKLALALKNFDQAIRCAPTLAVAHSSRGAVLKKLKRLDEAVAACTEAIRLGLRAPEPYCNRGSAYAEMRKFDEAIRDFRMALEIDSRFEEAAKNLRLLGVTVQ
jgi:tetratricopeptide (TPR) repeat protein